MVQLSQIGVDAAAHAEFLKAPLPRPSTGAQAPGRTSLAQPSSEAALSCAQAVPKVAILLCTLHGQHYLTEQLDSFATQTHHNWEVWASDDGSEDDTHAILESYKSKWPEGRLSIHFGPAEGFAANFLSLTCKASIDADYYAYSDQDDVWEPDKLERAIRWLSSIPANIPALYCSRTRLVDADNNEIGLSPLFSRRPSFANALIQSIGGGNTMVFNNAARALLRSGGENVSVASHDWWAYMVVTGCGGQVFYDCHPTLRYRQHARNLFGTNSGLRAKWTRARMLWQGQLRHWNDGNITALRTVWDKLTPENREILERFAQARKMRLAPRLLNIAKCGVYRQTTLGNLGFLAAAVFTKI